LRRTCRECRLLEIEAIDIDCPCLPNWPDGLRSSLLPRLLVAGGSLGDGPVHTIDRAPTSWLALAGGLIALVALVAAVVFVL
jgi:hypothetical protein